jgi:hypothetical protein
MGEELLRAETRSVACRWLENSTGTFHYTTEQEVFPEVISGHPGFRIMDLDLLYMVRVALGVLISVVSVGPASEQLLRRLIFV